MKYDSELTYQSSLPNMSPASLNKSEAVRHMYTHGHRQLDSSHNPKHVHFTFQSITLIRNPRLKYNNLRIEASPWIPNQLEASGCLQCMYGGAIFKFFSNFFQTFQMRITFPQGSFPRHFTTSLFTCSSCSFFGLLAFGSFGFKDNIY